MHFVKHVCRVVKNTFWPSSQAPPPKGEGCTWVVEFAGGNSLPGPPLALDKSKVGDQKYPPKAQHPKMGEGEWKDVPMTKGSAPPRSKAGCLCSRGNRVGVAQAVGDTDI